MRIHIIALALLSISFSLFGIEYSDYYGSASEAAESSRDINTGLTAFELLLIPGGGKYESMGTAYTAVAMDAVSMESNPASTSVLENTELSILHNDWIGDSKIEGLLYTIRFDNLGIGFGSKFLYLPFTEYDQWGNPIAKGYPSETVTTINISYNFFSSYYFYGLALGANLKAAYRHIPTSIYENQSVLSAMADVGILTRFDLFKFYASRDRNFSVGAAVKNLGFAALGDPLPTVATVGLAYSPLRPLLISFDFNYPFTLYSEIPAAGWYMAVGMDLTITDFFAVQGGFYYRGSNPRISLGSTVDFTDISLAINYTLDMTTQVEAPDRFSLEAKLLLGDEGRYVLQKRVEELYLAGLEAYAKGNLRTAIRYWEATLQLDSTFQPAREILQTAEEALELQEEMRELNRVE